MEGTKGRLPATAQTGGLQTPQLPQLSASRGLIPILAAAVHRAPPCRAPRQALYSESS